MANLVLFGTEYEVPEEGVLYNDYRAIFYKEAQEVQKKMHNAFKASKLTCKADFDKIVETGRGLLSNSLAMVIRELTEKEIYDYSVDSLRRNAVEPLTKLEDASADIYNQLNAIDFELQRAEAARQAEINRASSSWSGGGFGIGGALKGAAQAALLNTASGAVTKISTSGDGKRAKNAHEIKIYNLLNGTATIKKICSALYDDVFYLVKTFVKILTEDKSENIRVVADEEIIKSNDIFNNMKSGVYSTKPEVEKSMWIKMLTIFPYNIDYFILLLKTHDECFDEIKTLIEWYNIPMDVIADTLIADKYSFDGITDLEEAQDKKTQLLAELEKYGVEQSSLIYDADRKINEILVQRRTYDQIVYRTEDDCEYAKQLNAKQQDAINGVDKSDLNATADLYIDILSSEDSKKYVYICKKNAAVLQPSIIDAVKNATSVEELDLNKKKIETLNDEQMNAAIIKQIDSKISALNMRANLNETKDKAIRAAKGLFGKAKGIFTKNKDGSDSDSE